MTTDDMKDTSNLTTEKDAEVLPSRNDRDSREEAIFAGALQLPVSKQRDYVLAACGDDATMVDQILALLQAHKDGGPLGESAAVASTQLLPPPPAGERKGDKIGRYQILQLLGQGGYGSVYMAEQEEPVRRRVALKLIKLGMDTEQVIARFEAERQALSMMEHPNIARVLDAGATDTGRPFFVMELVRGIKITDYCDQNQLSTAKRLELFGQVCRAIQHAHQKGIIHRDIKPSNILVTLHDGVPVPKVIDFGIAKAIHQRLTDKTVFTELQQFIGTPAYMSPEQAEMSGLDVDTRSDVYSLGVLLYELLTSQTPFDPAQLAKAGLDAMRRTIREQEPPRPSTKLSTMLAADLTTIARHRCSAPPKLIHQVRGDLDWIVMKALEKDRTRRYETASNFASDIEHFLHNEPVTAHPPSQLYRFQKLVGRNKVVFAASCAVAVAVLGGLVLSTWMFFIKQEALRRADTEARSSQQVATFLKEMLQGVGPAVAQGRDTLLLRDILENTVKRVTTELRDQPEVQAEICNTIGEVYRALGNPAKAERMHRDARALQGQNPRTNPAAVATSLNDLALVLRDQGQLAEAEALHRQALQLRRKLFGENNADVANSLNNLGLVLRDQGKAAEAEGLHRAALATQKKLFGERHSTVATSLNNLALALRDQGKLADAETRMRESLAMQKELSADNKPTFAMTLDSLAFILRNQDRLDEAEKLERQSLDLLRRILPSDHALVATALHNLSLIRSAQGNFDDAHDLCLQSLAMRRRLQGAESREVASSLDNLSLILRKLKRFPESETNALSALAIRKKLDGETSLPVAYSLNTLGLIFRDSRKLRESEDAFRQALIMQKKYLSEDHPDVATTLSNLALTLRDEGDLTSAEAAIRAALAARKKTFGDTHPIVTNSLIELTNVLALQHKSATPQ
jgi:serine/threonine protein kinase/tetratricopeptide (TPR) repeat protein